MKHSPSVHPFARLESSDQLDALMVESRERPVVIFKHSPTCGTSAQAFDELSDLLGEDGVAVHLVNVLYNRPLSQAIGARFGVRHESPQVLVLVDGDVRWHGSHYRVTADAVRKAVVSSRTPRQDT
jgi:bacillithiol system protein YtxJ